LTLVVNTAIFGNLTWNFASSAEKIPSAASMTTTTTSTVALTK